MPGYIRSPNPDFQEMSGEDALSNYRHPVDTRSNHPIPMAFQVTSPFNKYKVLLPHALVLHVNPSSLQESSTPKIERFQTRGGYQEQHWGSELTEISAEGSTGAFMNLNTGLSSVTRHESIAWDRYRDLHDLYYNNGSIYDPSGSIVLQGNLMLMYDRGVYLGNFRTFEVSEAADAPFVFSLNWTFKVEYALQTVSYSVNDIGPFSSPTFQRQNKVGSLPARSLSEEQDSAISILSSLEDPDLG